MMRDDTVEVLLVEDNPTDAELTLACLREGGVHGGVVWARDGAEALAILTAGAGGRERRPLRPRIILLDLRMPRLDGKELLRAIKQDPGTRDIPVVAFTSSRQPEDVGECYRLGVNSYVAKPVEFGAYRDAVKGLVHYWLRVNEGLPD